MEVEQRIKEIMSEVFQVPVEDIRPDTSPEEVENWDSLTHLNMVLALEEEFSIRFESEQVVEMLSFELICRMVNEQVVT